MASSASEVEQMPLREQGSWGIAPGNFLEFKSANYPDKQSGTNWQEISVYEHITLTREFELSLQFELSLYMKYQMDPVTFMWFIST